MKLTCLFLLLTLTGCTTFRTVQESVNKDGTRATTEIHGTAFFDSKGAIAGLAARQSDKSQAMGINSINQEASGSNVVALAEAIARGVTQGAVKTVVP